MDADSWDERYAAGEYVWTVTVNRFVEEHLRDLPPGRAVDLGAGEGRNAVWLARQGWDVTAVDFSAAGLEKGRRLAADHGVAVTFVEADATTWAPDEPVDLVVLAYLQLPGPARRTVLEHAATWLRPGGRVFVIAHDQRNVAEGHGGPPAVEVCYDADETVTALTGLTIEQAGIVERVVGDGPDAPVALDTLVLAVRPAD